MRQLLEAENADRIVHSIAYQMRAARFPVRRDLAGFAFSESAVDEALVRKQWCRLIYRPWRRSPARASPRCPLPGGWAALDLQIAKSTDSPGMDMLAGMR